MLPDDRDFGPAMARLTQRQRIFVDGLFCGLKQTAAARRARYSNRGHADAVVGHRLAHNDKVQAAIREEPPACRRRWS
jgi:phage terminase small subunit